MTMANVEMMCHQAIQNGRRRDGKNYRYSFLE